MERCAAFGATPAVSVWEEMRRMQVDPAQLACSDVAVQAHATPQAAAGRAAAQLETRSGLKEDVCLEEGEAEDVEDVSSSSWGTIATLSPADGHPESTSAEVLPSRRNCT